MKSLSSVFNLRIKTYCLITILLLLTAILFYDLTGSRSFAQINTELGDRIFWDEFLIGQVGIEIASPIDWTINSFDNKVTISNFPTHFVNSITIINHGLPAIDNLKAMTNVLLKQCLDSEQESSHSGICNVYQPTGKSLSVIDGEPVMSFVTGIDETNIYPGVKDDFVNEYREVLVTFHNNRMFEIQIDYEASLYADPNYKLSDDDLQELSIKDNIINSIKWLNDTTLKQNVVEKNTTNTTGIYCGAMIKSDVKLTEDLFCNGDGLIAYNKDNLIIDLNSHTISGPGNTSESAGILVLNSENMTILGNGAIKNFQIGVLNEGNNNHIYNLEVRNNEIGISNNKANDTEINENKIHLNDIGIKTVSNDNFNIVNNNITSNDIGIKTVSNDNFNIVNNNITSKEDGISMSSSNNGNIVSNSIKGSKYGLNMGPTNMNNSVSNNQFSDNERWDIIASIVASEYGNYFSDNNCNTSNPDGLCPGK
ncbi:MAG: right-handed parallel beta-helix repeat-containing protein [Candidatus Nitrosocosmicus sp.]